jgi:hypothetical protein
MKFEGTHSWSGRTNILFKGTEKTKHGLILEDENDYDDDDDDE